MRARLSVLLILCTISSPLPVQAIEPDDFLVGPIAYQQDVNGVPVTITARTYFQIQTLDNKLYLKAQVVANLGDLQKKLGTIVDTFKLPQENCQSYSANNPVVSIPRKELLFSDGKALFSISGTVALWDCRENPVPNSKVEWEIRRVGFIKTKVPVIKTWPGSPIKNKLGSQSFDATLPILLMRENDYTIKLVFAKPDVDLKGPYAFIAEGILKIAGIDINQKAHDALNKAIDPAKLKVAVPEEFQDLNPQIKSARFIDDGGQLAAEVDMSALIPAEKITEMIKDLIDRKK